VRIVENDPVGRPLDGTEVLLDIPLRLEVDAHLLDASDQPYVDTNLVDSPVALILSDGHGGALSDGSTTCDRLATPPGSFTYWNSSRASLHHSYDELDGSPCCYVPTQLIQAFVTVSYEADDGQGGTVQVSHEASTVAESAPRPADPCEIRPWPPGALNTTIEVAGIGERLLPLGESSQPTWAFSAYAIDACGNLNFLPEEDPPSMSASLLSPVDPDVWVEVEQTDDLWDWNVLLRSTHCADPPCDPASDSYFVPDGIYDIQVSTPGVCGGPATYVQTIDHASERPRIRLVWEQGGLEPDPPMASPGSALRNPNTGEVIAWRVKPTDHRGGTPVTETIYTDIPVRLYVAEATVQMDWDGNIVESHSKVDDAEICVGQVHWHYDPDAAPDPGWDVTTTTCDQVFTGETTVLAYTEPDWSGGAFDGYTGVAAGISKVPDQGGRYLLVAEPLDERFRRGDAWNIATPVRLVSGEYYLNFGTSKKEFEVGGGVFLDGDYRPANPYIVDDNIDGIYLVDAGSAQGASHAYLTTFGPDGNPVSEDVPVPLTPSADGVNLIGHFDLVQGVCDHTGAEPFVRVGLGNNTVAATFSRRGPLKQGRAQHPEGTGGLLREASADTSHARCIWKPCAGNRRGAQDRNSDWAVSTNANAPS
jgi:hypothetical protein